MLIMIINNKDVKQDNTVLTQVIISCLHIYVFGKQPCKQQNAISLQGPDKLYFCDNDWLNVQYILFQLVRHCFSMHYKKPIINRT